MLPIQNANTSGGYFLLTGDTKVIDTLIDQHGGVWNASARQIRMAGGDTYTTRDKDTSDSGSRLHLIDIPSSQNYTINQRCRTDLSQIRANDVTAFDTADGDASPNAEDDQLWGRLLAEINYMANLKSVMFDHKTVYDNLKRDWSEVTLRRYAKTPMSTGDHSSTMQKHIIMMGELEIVGIPFIEQYLPPDDPYLISKFLCEWPILIVEIVEDSTKSGRMSYVLPLDPLEDVITVSKGFRRELDRFLEGPPTENHFDFSVFSALHVMELLASYASPFVNDESISCGASGNSSGAPAGEDGSLTLWVPFALRPGQLHAFRKLGCDVISNESAAQKSQLFELNSCCAEVGKEILTNSFCAYQFLRYVCISIKSGFESLVDQKPDQPMPFYDALAALRKNLKELSICSQIGLRCSYSPVKYAALLMYGLSKQADHQISHADLLRLSQYSRVKCDVGNIFPTDPKKLLPIQKLSTYLKDVVEQTPIINRDVAHSDLGAAFERLRQIGNASANFDSVWFQFNADLFYMSTIAHQTMRGEISQKSLSSIWDLPRSFDPNIQWLAVFAAGFAFTLELPSRIFDFLQNGRLNYDLEEIFKECEDEKDYFLIHLDYKDLPWQDYRERLKEMYRLKESWTKLELCAWLDRCLTKNAEPITDIIQKYLKSRANSMQYENENLHLEKR